MSQLTLTPLTSLSRAVRLAMFGLSLASVPALALMPLQASAQSQVAYHIGAGPLGTALTQFGVQAGVTLSFDTEQTRHLTTAGLEGSYTVEQGLARLLGNSGLQAQRQGNGGYVLVASSPQGTLELGATQVEANQLGTVTEGTGSYTPGTIATATRLVLTPRETPQSISVITRQAMDDFGLNGIDDVMRHTPGITVSTYDSERTNYYSRGFSIQNFQYDGIPMTRNAAYSAGQTLTDTAIYDRIEVLKGATGLLTGAGGPGGTINLIRKKPTSEFKGHIDLGAGSWDNYRSEIDISGPLTESGNVRGRAVAAYQDKHSFMDHYERKTSVYYGILEFDLDEDTLLTLGADYQDNDPKGSGWSGSRPVYDRAGNVISVPRSFNNGAKWSKWEQYSRTVFATLEHTFANSWVAKGQYNHQINGYNAPLGSLSSPDAVTGLSSIYANKYTGKTVSDSGDFYVTGPFSLLGREHQLVAGASIATSRWQGKDYWNTRYVDGNSFDFYNWDGNSAEPDWGELGYKNDETTRQTGGYMTARFSLKDDLHLLLGTRVANFQVTGTSQTKDTGKVLPYAGLVYDLDDNFSLYTSYSTIYLPHTAYRDTRNKMLEPNEGKNYELGIKGEFYEGRLNASLAYFEVKEENRAEQDLTYEGVSLVANPYKGITARTKGYEAEISGELAPGWQVQAGYTHKVIRDQHGDKVSTWEPEDQLNFYTTYKLQGAWDKLTVGGGARWQGEGWQILTNRGTQAREKFAQDAYWLVDAMARYQLTDSLSATLNVNNVFDKKYYTNIGFYNSSYYGDPRNVMVSTRWDF